VSPFPPAPVITQNFNVLTSTPAQSYQWNLGGNPIPGATNQSYTATQNGNYTVTITQNGCTITSPVYQYLSAGINELSSDWNLFPNPVNSNLTIQSAANSDIRKIEITDLKGRIILTIDNNDNKINNTQIDIGTSMLSDGPYIIRMIGDAFTLTRRFLVQR
jgi:hypothetical protein